MSDVERAREHEIVHRLKNQLSIILGFSELLSEDFPADDPRRNDLDEIRSAAMVALQAMPELARRLSQGGS
jgi:signal transduction histidine kinase